MGVVPTRTYAPFNLVGRQFVEGMECELQHRDVMVIDLSAISRQKPLDRILRHCLDGAFIVIIGFRGVSVKATLQTLSLKTGEAQLDRAGMRMAAEPLRELRLLRLFRL